ncbi:MAG: hypothetical protein MI748_07640 [Opitutales bacterium]|nr:hypothetical protein [Opitutales bacterium]
MADESQLINKAKKLLKLSGFHITQEELSTLKLNDFGLDNLPTEGFAFIDLLRTELVRVTLMVLQPHQALPQHKHPPYEGEPTGKEESVRTLYGEFRVYDEGENNAKFAKIPSGKEPYYTSLNEHVLKVGDQYSVAPNTAHWFQAGPDGAVVIAFQNRVVEDHNIFYDPASDGCPIPTENTGQY